MTNNHDRRPVALLSAATEAGGARMRISSLHEALGGDRNCLRMTILCSTYDPQNICKTKCLATGAVRNDTAHSWWFDRTFCPAYLDALIEQLRSASVTAVICSSLDTSRYLRPLAERLSIPVVFDMHNVELALYRAVLETIPTDSDGHDFVTPEFVDHVAATEKTAIATADELWVCSSDDAQLLQATYPSVYTTNVRVVPNVLPVQKTPPKFATPARVVFTGRLDYEPNINAGLSLIHDVAPALVALGSPLPIVLAGADPHPDLAAAVLPANVRLLANPVSVDDVIAGSIMAAPLREGGGSRFKILEAFRHGAPVVSTAKGVEGLEVQENVHYLRAETGAEFAAAVETLRRDQELRRGLTQRAWRLLVQKYSVSALREQLSGWSPSRSERAVRT
jgi:glycosyltransferase involved in cell wall biosynthesis